MAEARFEVYGPTGALWFSLADCTTRQVGSYRVTGPNPALPTTTAVSGVGWSYHIDFLCPPNTAPWLTISATSRTYALGEVTRLNSTTARVTFNLGYPNTGWVAGESVNLRYGWGAA